MSYSTVRLDDLTVQHIAALKGRLGCKNMQAVVKESVRILKEISDIVPNQSLNVSDDHNLKLILADIKKNCPTWPQPEPEWTPEQAKAILQYLEFGMPLSDAKEQVLTDMKVME